MCTPSSLLHALCHKEGNASTAAHYPSSHVSPHRLAIYEDSGDPHLQSTSRPACNVFLVFCHARRGHWCSSTYPPPTSKQEQPQRKAREERLRQPRATHKDQEGPHRAPKRDYGDKYTATHPHHKAQPPPPRAALRAKGWVHDVLHDGDVEANRGPRPGAAAPALPGSTSSVHPWNDSTTIGDITLFLGSTASTQTKISTLVALHHHLLQQCHLRCNTLPEEEHNGTSRLPTDESAYAPNTPGSLQLGTTEIHATPLPRSPRGCLDRQCPNCGIDDFYLPRCSSCGNQEWGPDPCLDAPVQVRIPNAGSPAATNCRLAHQHPFPVTHTASATQEVAPPHSPPQDWQSPINHGIRIPFLR